MKIFASVGHSDSGKTRLIRKLVVELKNRGRNVSVIKHCSHGFDLAEQGKDTAQFGEAGSASVCMYSLDGMVVIQQKNTELDAKQISREYLKGSDFILIEGNRTDKALKNSRFYAKGSQKRPSVLLKNLSPSCQIMRLE
jgi:molybdopterin-guanine dinucleotide biosynthesis protein B